MTKKYVEVADRITTWVFETAYKPGDRLPSIRSLSATLSVSITTVTAALRMLESRGILQVKDRKGYFVSPHVELVRDVSDSDDKNSTDHANTNSSRDHLKLNKTQSIQLGSATPSELYLPTRKIQHSLIKASRQSFDSLSYSFPGNPAYLRGIAKRMASLGVNVKASEIISMGGAQEALALALRAITHEGDSVAVGAPASPGTLQALRSLGRSIVEVPCEADGRLSLEALELVISNSEIKAVCVSANLSNPTGYSFSENEKKQFLSIVSDRGIPVIEDDVFGDLFYGPKRPEPLKAFDQSGSVIYCSSFSKTVSAGLRCGWVIPGKFYSEVSDQKYFMNLSSPAVTQSAVAHYLESGAHERYLRKIRRKYRDNLLKLRDLALDKFPSGTTATFPQGGFLFWVSLPKGINTTQAYRIAMEARICFAPGQLFSSSGDYENCLRMSVTQPLDSEAVGALSLLAEIFYDIAEEKAKRQ